MFRATVKPGLDARWKRDADEVDVQQSHVRLEPEGVLVASDGSTLIMTQLAPSDGDPPLSEAVSIPRQVAELAIKQARTAGAEVLDLEIDTEGPTFYAKPEQEEESEDDGEALTLRFHPEVEGYPAWIDPASEAAPKRTVTFALDPRRLKTLAEIAMKQGAPSIVIIAANGAGNMVELRWRTTEMVTTALVAPMSFTAADMPPRVVPQKEGA